MIYALDVGWYYEEQGETVAEYFRLTYWDDVEFGVAWFIAALLAFSVVYAAWRSRHPAPTGHMASLGRGDLARVAAFIAVASFVVRLQFPVLSGDVAWTLNLWEYPQMIALFAPGGARQGARLAVRGPVAAAAADVRVGRRCRRRPRGARRGWHHHLRRRGAVPGRVPARGDADPAH